MKYTCKNYSAEKQNLSFQFVCIVQFTLHREIKCGECYHFWLWPVDHNRAHRGF